MDGKLGLHLKQEESPAKGWDSRKVGVDCSRAWNRLSWTRSFYLCHHRAQQNIVSCCFFVCIIIISMHRIWKDHLILSNSEREDGYNSYFSSLPSIQISFKFYLRSHFDWQKYLVKSQSLNPFPVSGPSTSKTSYRLTLEREKKNQQFL